MARKSSKDKDKDKDRNNCIDENQLYINSLCDVILAMSYNVNENEPVATRKVNKKEVKKK